MGPKDQFPTVGFDVPKEQSLRKSVRRLRWFKSTFREQVDAAETRTGISFHINTPALTECFVRWVRAFEEGKPNNEEERYAFVGHSSGLMLAQLITRQPLQVAEMPKASDLNLPEYFWPEGFVYVSYCLNVRQAVLRQDFDTVAEPSPSFSDIRTWWSFRENVKENPDYAVSFLDLFAGQEPDWSAPSIFRPESFTKPIETCTKTKPSNNPTTQTVAQSSRIASER